MMQCENYCGKLRLKIVSPLLSDEQIRPYGRKHGGKLPHYQDMREGEEQNRP